MRPDFESVLVQILEHYFQSGQPSGWIEYQRLPGESEAQLEAVSLRGDRDT